jgi:hypothetical protein
VTQQATQPRWKVAQSRVHTAHWVMEALERAERVDEQQQEQAQRAHALWCGTSRREAVAGSWMLSCVMREASRSGSTARFGAAVRRTEPV